MFRPSGPDHMRHLTGQNSPSHQKKWKRILSPKLDKTKSESERYTLTINLLPIVWKNPAPQGLVVPLIVFSLLTHPSLPPTRNHSPPSPLSPTILSFLCSSSASTTFLLSRRCPPGNPQPLPDEEGGAAPANLAAFKLQVNWLRAKAPPPWPWCK